LGDSVHAAKNSNSDLMFADPIVWEETICKLF